MRSKVSRFGDANRLTPAGYTLKASRAAFIGPQKAHCDPAGRRVKLAGMDSSNLTEKQLDNLFERLAPLTRYLARLRKRIASRAFPKDDELAVLVRQADDAVHRLKIRVHYQSCVKADIFNQAFRRARAAAPARAFPRVVRGWTPVLCRSFAAKLPARAGKAACRRKIQASGRESCHRVRSSTFAERSLWRTD